jgi:hypothetical protein
MFGTLVTEVLNTFVELAVVEFVVTGNVDNVRELKATAL